MPRFRFRCRRKKQPDLLIQGDIGKVLEDEELRGQYRQAILDRRGLSYPVNVVEGTDTMLSDRGQRAQPFLESESIVIASLPCCFMPREAVPRDHLRLGSNMVLSEVRQFQTYYSPNAHIYIAKQVLCLHAVGEPW
jgi:hypothetical protein